LIYLDYKDRVNATESIRKCYDILKVLDEGAASLLIKLGILFIEQRNYPKMVEFLRFCGEEHKKMNLPLYLSIEYVYNNGKDLRVKETRTPILEIVKFTPFNTPPVIQRKKDIKYKVQSLSPVTLKNNFLPI